jgi:hypothetical protein
MPRRSISLASINPEEFLGVWGGTSKPQPLPGWFPLVPYGEVTPVLSSRPTTRKSSTWACDRLAWTTSEPVKPAGGPLECAKTRSS